MAEVAGAVARFQDSLRLKTRAGDSGTIRLDVGDPDLATPKHVLDAAIQAVHGGFTHYPPPNGDPELRQAFADNLNQRGGDFGAENVCVCNGASGALYSTLVAYIRPGDEVIIFDPSYSLYTDLILSAGGKPVPVGWTSAGRLDVEALRAAVTDRTRMLVVSSPNNPTGTVLRREEWDSIADFVEVNDLILLSDEAYDHLVFDDIPTRSAAAYRDIAARTLIVNTCSKTYAMTGWRVGYVAAPVDLLRGPALLNRTITGGVNHIAQRAAIAALGSDDGWHEGLLAEFTHRRNAMHSRVNAIPGLHCERPDGAFYVFANVRGELSSESVADHCLAYGVAVRAGREFGSRGEHHIRLSFSSPDTQFLPGLDRLAQAMEALETAS